MTREEREALIEKLHADIASNLEDLAMRQARTARGEDPPEWKVPPEKQRRSGSDNSAGVIYKDFPIERQLSHAQPQQRTTMSDAESAPWNEWATTIATQVAEAYRLKFKTDDGVVHRGIDAVSEFVRPFLTRSTKKIVGGMDAWPNWEKRNGGAGYVG